MVLFSFSTRTLTMQEIRVGGGSFQKVKQLLMASVGFASNRRICPETTGMCALHKYCCIYCAVHYVEPWNGSRKPRPTTSVRERTPS